MRSLWFSLPIAQVPRDTADIIEGGQIASEAVAESWNQLWDSVLQGGLYFALARVGVLFAVATLLFFLTQWTRRMVEGDSQRAYADFILDVSCASPKKINGL